MWWRADCQRPPPLHCAMYVQFGMARHHAARGSCSDSGVGIWCSPCTSSRPPCTSGGYGSGRPARPGPDGRWQACRSSEGRCREARDLQRSPYWWAGSNRVLVSFFVCRRLGKRPGASWDLGTSTRQPPFYGWHLPHTARMGLESCVFTGMLPYIWHKRMPSFKCRGQYGPA